MIVWETTKTRDNLPRIGYAMPAVTPSASTAAAGYGAALAANGDTFDAWKPVVAPSSLRYDFASQVINYVGIAAHTVGTAGASVKVQYLVGADFVDVPGTLISPDSDDAIFWLIKDVTTTAIRIFITGAIAEVGVMKCGQVTRFPFQRKANYLGTVGRDARVIEYADNYSVTGEKLGRTVRSDGLEFEFAVQYLPEAWAAENWPALQEHCIGQDGLFVAPKPSEYPEECYFAWNTSKPTLDRTMARAEVSRTLQMNLRGYKRT